MLKVNTHKHTSVGTLTCNIPSNSKEFRSGDDASIGNNGDTETSNDSTVEV